MSGRPGRPPKGDAAKAFRLRQVPDENGNPRHTWDYIARRSDFANPHAAMMAAKRYGQSLSDDDGRWADHVPDVASHIRREYFYLRLMAEAKRNAGEKLSGKEESLLDNFHREVARTSSEEPLGIVLVYDPELELWGQRPRLPDDDPSKSWAPA